MRIFESRPALRWLVPVAALAAVAGTSLIAGTATADPVLPPRTAEQLLVDVQDAQLTDLSGTVIQTSDLGLPELPDIGGQGLTALLSGTHTLRVWLSGEDKARLAVLSPLGEYDVIRDGADVWTWQSEDNTATHRTIPADAEHPEPEGTPQTPQEIADEILDALQPTTDVATDRTVSVAGRDAYELLLTPKTGGSLLTEIRVAVDAATGSPLRVQVYAGETIVFEVGYSSVDFTRPEDRQFDFVAPPGAKVTEVPAGEDGPSKPTREEKPSADDEPTIVGSGWSTVVVAELSRDSAAGNQERDDQQLQAILESLPKVQGAWGSGRLLTSKAFSVVITDDGRVAAGSVTPDVLYDALAEVTDSRVTTFGLTKQFRRQRAVDAVDLVVPAGSVYGFLGPNGSGKTTTIRMLLGLIWPTDGRVELLGRPMPSAAGEVLPRVGSLVEGPAFHPYLSGRANLARLDAADRAADPATASRRVDAALERVGLLAAATKRYRAYSLGMRQRLAIASALLMPRELLILDEPTNGLDPQGTREVRHLITELADDGMTVLVSSHLLSEVEQMCDQLGVMHLGKLLWQGALADLRAGGVQTVRVESDTPEDAAGVLRALGLTEVAVAGQVVTALLGQVALEKIVPELVRADVSVLGFTVVTPSLEDLFVSLTGEGFDVSG